LNMRCSLDVYSNPQISLRWEIMVASTCPPPSAQPPPSTHARSAPPLPTSSDTELLWIKRLASILE
jgi:hypothetical protein